MNNSISHYIWCFLWSLAGLLTLVGCGLPDYLVLESPVVASGPNPSTLAFNVPANNSNITGYAIYYKVYSDDSDFDLEEDQSRWFKESTYISLNDEMQPGSVIPSQHGFIRVGEEGDQSYKAILITDVDPVTPPNLTPGTTIYIDFDSNTLIKSESITDDSDFPIVGFGTYPISTAQFTLARGVVDASTDNFFLSFIADWDIDDADFKRRYNTPLNSDVTSMTTYLESGTTIVDGSSSELLLGFAVHSVGYDPSNLQSLSSVPVFIGKIRYSPLNITNR